MIGIWRRVSYYRHNGQPPPVWLWVVLIVAGTSGVATYALAYRVGWLIAAWVTAWILWMVTTWRSAQVACWALTGLLAGFLPFWLSDIMTWCIDTREMIQPLGQDEFRAISPWGWETYNRRCGWWLRL